MDAGTLLGLVRDKEFIAHDTDIDFAVLLNRDAIEEVKFPDIQIMRTIYWDRLPMQIAYVDHETIVDFYFYYLDEESGNYVNINTDCTLSLPGELLLPVTKISVKDFVDLPVPNETERYLEWTYGVDWKIPRASKQPWVIDRPNLGSRNDISFGMSNTFEWKLLSSLRNLDNQLLNRVAERDLALVERDQLTQERDQLTQERDQLKERIFAVLNSRTWKLLKLYRRIKESLLKR